MRYWLSIWRWGFYDTVIPKALNGNFNNLRDLNKDKILKLFHFVEFILFNLNVAYGIATVTLTNITDKK